MHGIGPASRAAPNHGHQSKRCDRLAQPLGKSRPGVSGPRVDRFTKHHIGDRDTNKGANDLGRDIRERVGPAQAALGRISEGHDRIEVRAGDGSEGEDERDQSGARRQRVGQQCDRHVAPRQPVAHDPGANDGREEHRRPDALRDETAMQ